MAFTVDDFQDLLRLIEQHPEWRAELRRQVLTEELLELPGLMRQLAGAQARTEQRLEALTAHVDTLTARVEALAEAQARTEQRLEALAAHVDTLTARVEALAEAQARTEQRFEALTAHVDTLTAHVEALAEVQARTEDEVARLARHLQELAVGQDRLADRLGAAVGVLTELRYRERAPAYFGRLARRLRVMDFGVLADRLEDAVEEGRLSWAEREAVLATDIVLTGRAREDTAEIYLLAEVSARIHPHDVERAVERAKLLEKLGRRVVPVVAGEAVNAEAATLARERGVWQFLDGLATPPQGQ